MKLFSMLCLIGITTGLGCKSQESNDGSVVKNYKSTSCSAVDINGQCTMDKDGQRETFQTSASRPCQCDFGPQEVAETGRNSTNGIGRDPARQQLPDSFDASSFEDSNRQAIDRQIADLQAMKNIPEQVKADMIAGLNSMRGSMTSPAWNGFPDNFNDFNGWGQGNTWSDNCSANYLNGQCVVTRNGKTDTGWAASLSACNQKCS